LADTKISALASATTPLAGTEVLPIVQGGVTEQVSVDNLTAGRSVSAANLTATSTTTNAGLFANYNGTNVGRFVAASNGNLYLGQQTGAGTLSVGTSANADLLFLIGAQIGLGTTSTTETVNIGGNARLNTGNLVQGTAAKGINFTANTPAAGMTSQLLNWYEEGTWTPSIGGTATYTTQTGKYTRVGRLVTFLCDITINVQGTGNAGVISGLPFDAAVSTPISVGYFSNLAASVVFPSGFAGGASINLYGLTAAAATASSLNILGDGARLMCSGTYEI